MTFTCVPNRLSAPPESRNTLSHYNASCSELIMLTSSLPQLQNEMQTLTGGVSRLFYVQFILRPRLSHCKTLLWPPPPRPSRSPCKWKQTTHSQHNTHYLCAAANQPSDGGVCRSFGTTARWWRCLTRASRRREAALPVHLDRRAARMNDALFNYVVVPESSDVKTCTGFTKHKLTRLYQLKKLGLHVKWKIMGRYWCIWM